MWAYVEIDGEIKRIPNELLNPKFESFLRKKLVDPMSVENAKLGREKTLRKEATGTDDLPAFEDNAGNN